MSDYDDNKHLSTFLLCLSHYTSCSKSNGSLLYSQDIALPVVAAEMALQCGAKKLILNHIGCQFLPTKINTVKNKHTDIRWDSELLLEVRERLSYLRFPLAHPNFYHPLSEQPGAEHPRSAE